MLTKKIHFDNNGTRLCHQDYNVSNITKESNKVTCKKCKRMLLNRIGLHGKSATSLLAIESVTPLDTLIEQTMSRANENLVSLLP